MLHITTALVLKLVIGQVTPPSKLGSPERFFLSHKDPRSNYISLHGEKKIQPGIGPVYFKQSFPMSQLFLTWMFSPGMDFPSKEGTPNG